MANFIEAETLYIYSAINKILLWEDCVANVNPKCTTDCEIADPLGETINSSFHDENINSIPSEGANNNRQDFFDASSAVREEQSQPLDTNTEEIKNRSAKEIVLEGKRVVDIQYFLNSLKSIGNHAPWMGCSLNSMEITGENRHGLNS
ncbi:hypothetical protein ILUMI_15656 [Ignelater luminosus]|uniref:Uncharacterized protein n=1 Tax=Ignelater luminosus TaxID=2038154 RepID=A0A8K0G6N2_IGNLU|nr:hypothetical protein ILUMI_15656 [Ignelater luminosus]